MDLDINRIQSNLPRRLLDLNLDLDRSLKRKPPTKLELIDGQIIVYRFDTIKKVIIFSFIINLSSFLNHTSKQKKNIKKIHEKRWKSGGFFFASSNEKPNNLHLREDIPIRKGRHFPSSSRSGNSSSSL